jgi:hypothetical protein
MILGRTFLLIHAIALLFPGGGHHSRRVLVVQANPLKRFFMMRRMKNGDTNDAKPPRGRNDRKLPKGSSDGSATADTATKLPRGGGGRDWEATSSISDDFSSDDKVRVASEAGATGRTDPVKRADAVEEPIIVSKNLPRREKTGQRQVPTPSPREEYPTPPAPLGEGIVFTASIETTDGAVSIAAKQDETVCVHPRQLEQVQVQLQEAQMGQSEWQKRHELYRQESESRLENLTRANESAYKIAKVQEDFAERITKMQQKMEINLEAAKATIAAREEELVALKAEMKENEARLMADMEKRIAQAKKDWQKQLSDVEANVNNGNEKIRAEYEGRMEKQAEANAILKGEKKLIAENYEKLQQKYETMLRNEEIALQAFLEVNLEKEANKKNEAFRDNLIAELESIKASSESTIAQLTSDLNSLSETSSATILELQAQYDDLKQTSEEKIKQLTADYAELQQTSQEKVAEITRNSERALEELRKQSAKDIEQAIANMESSHGEAMSKLTAQVASLQTERKGLVSTIKSTSAKLSTTEQKYDQAKSDAQYWEEKFELRSYLNLTHLTTDASAYASTAAAPVVQSTRSLYESQVGPSVAKSKALYDSHLRPTVDRAASVATPVYNNHLAPHLETAKTTVSQTSKSVFDGLKSQYEAACPSAMASLRDMEKSTGLLLPDSIVESTRYSCQHSDESVAAFLKVTVIVLALLFRRSLWRLLVGSAGLALGLVYRLMVAPWRLAFGGDKINKVQPDGAVYSNGGTGGTPPRKPVRTMPF